MELMTSQFKYFDNLYKSVIGGTVGPRISTAHAGHACLSWLSYKTNSLPIILCIQLINQMINCNIYIVYIYIYIPL